MRASWLKAQFSSRYLLLATALLAIALAVFLWKKRSVEIDPRSERVWVGGEVIDAKWEEADWQWTAGVSMPGAWYNTRNWNGQGQFLIKQPLLTVAYNNYHGREVFRANVNLKGARTADWAEYWMEASEDGKWTNDGGTSLSCSHTPSSSTLELVVIQFFNAERRAKRLVLEFERVGDTFVWRKDGNSN